MAAAGIARRNPFDLADDLDGKGRHIKIELLGLALFGALGLCAKIYLEGDSLILGAGLLGVVFLILVFKNLVYGIFALVFAIGLSPDSVWQETLGYPNVRFEDFMLPVFLFVWFIRHQQRKDELVKTDVFSAIKIYMFFLCITTLIGIAEETIWSMSLTVPFMGKYVEYFIFFWFVLNNVKDKEDLILVITASIFACTLVGVHSYFNRIEAMEELGKSFVRATGPEGETPNVLGGYYMFHIMIAFSMLFVLKKYTHKLYLLAFILVIGLPFLYTYSRTSFVSLLFGVLVTIVLVDIRYVFLFMFMAFFGSLFMPEGMLNDDSGLFSRYDSILHIFDQEGHGRTTSSWQARYAGWYNYANETWHQRPLIGRGVGSVYSGIDSAYVKKFIESGLIGLFLFMMLLLRLYRVAMEINRTTDDPVYKSFAIGYLGGLAGMLMHAVGVSSFSTIRTAEIFWVFSGLMVATHWQVMKQKEVDEEEVEDKEDLSFSKPSLAFNSYTRIGL